MPEVSNKSNAQVQCDTKLNEENDIVLTSVAQSTSVLKTNKVQQSSNPDNVEKLQTELEALRAEVDRLQNAHTDLQTQIMNKSPSVLNLKSIGQSANFHIFSFFHRNHFCCIFSEENMSSMHVKQKFDEEFSKSLQNLRKTDLKVNNPFLESIISIQYSYRSIC